ncbi:MAG TPA: addiction module toxin, HicA family [bacterium]|nr:addiction module toxin, HicA family [bacterium]
MKRQKLLRHLRFYGCCLRREGAKHSLFENPANGSVEAIPRHVEIDYRLVEKICRQLDIPLPSER